MKYIIISGLTHLIVAVMLILSFQFIQQPQDHELTRMLAMINTAMAAQLTTDITLTKQEEPLPHRMKAASLKRLTQKPLLGKKNIKIKYNDVLTVLHRAIAEHQRYPKLASMLHQTGKVSIQFLAQPSGKLLDIHIIKSSTLSSLDQAAVAAVAMASPVSGLHRYLRREQLFTIDILFD